MNKKVFTSSRIIVFTVVFYLCFTTFLVVKFFEIQKNEEKQTIATFEEEVILVAKASSTLDEAKSGLQKIIKQIEDKGLEDTGLYSELVYNYNAMCRVKEGDENNLLIKFKDIYRQKK